jgi:hypothetical protein
VILRYEHKLKVFEKRVLRTQTDAVTGGRRKLHNEEHHNFHFSPNTINKDDDDG